MSKHEELKPHTDLQVIELALVQARPHRLEAEVVWSAMRHYEKYHKQAPETYSMEWALEVALADWDI